MKKLITHSLLIIGFVTAFVIGPFAGSASAAPTSEQCKDATYRRSLEQYYKLQNLEHYDPCSVSVCATGHVQSDTKTTIEKTETITAIYTYLTTTPLSTNQNKPLSPVQAAGIMGNFAAESNFNPSAIEDTSRAEKGHGLAQWTFGRWTNLSNFARTQGKPWDDLNVQLAFLKSELEGPEKKVLTDTQFASTKDPTVAAVQWRVVFERADPKVAHDDRRMSVATAIYTMFGGVAASCDLTSAVVAGNFVQTAKNFALATPATDTMNKQTDARDTYRQAKPKYSPAADWTDCGAYVATSLISSGVDTKYPPVSTVAQLAYVKATTNKYVIQEKPTLADLKSGDILFVEGHTTIYTGDSKYPMLDASLNQRVPSVRESVSLQWMLSQPDLVSARLLK